MNYLLLLLSCSNNVHYEEFIEHWWQPINPPSELENIECFILYQMGSYPAGDLYIYNTDGLIQGPISWYKYTNKRILIDNLGYLVPTELENDIWKIKLTNNVYVLTSEVKYCDKYVSGRES